MVGAVESATAQAHSDDKAMMNADELTESWGGTRGPASRFAGASRLPPGRRRPGSQDEPRREPNLDNSFRHSPHNGSTEAREADFVTFLLVVRNSCRVDFRRTTMKHVQQIMVDGKLAASNHNAQYLGSGGNHDGPVDLPTIGESVSGFWSNNQHEGGFEGIVAKFRASMKQNDWLLSVAEPSQSANNRDVQHQHE